MKSGFTVIEIIIVLAIMAVVLSIGLPVAGRFQIDSQLNESSALLMENLRLAEQDSQSGWHDSSYGLKFFNDRYVIFQGRSYADRDAGQDRIVPILSSLNLAWSLAPAGDEIAFDRRGKPRSFGDLKIAHDNGATKVLTINQAGIINRQ